MNDIDLNFKMHKNSNEEAREKSIIICVFVANKYCKFKLIINELLHCAENSSIIFIEQIIKSILDICQNKLTFQIMANIYIM